jgi:uncharacterized protein YbaA (DUF1428 family)
MNLLGSMLHAQNRTKIDMASTMIMYDPRMVSKIEMFVLDIGRVVGLQRID